jgi:SAM-dependent methyltransferase
MRRAFPVLWAILAACGPTATPPAPAPAPPRYEHRAVHDRDGIGKFYMGREIAHVITGPEAAEWLDRPEREREESPRKLVEALELGPEDRVADIGAGTGYVTLLMAPRAKKVYAVDIQPDMLALLREKAAEGGIRNVETVVGTETDPRLPPASVDLALLVDVYHEFAWPWEMMTTLRGALRPGGRVALVEYRGEDPSIPIKPLHKMTEAQVRREMEAAGYRWEKTLEPLPVQHIVIFSAGPGR